MLSKNKIKYIQSLRLKKFRQKYNSFLLEGDKMVKELLLDKDYSIEMLVATPSWIIDNIAAKDFEREQIIEVSEKELKQISNLSTPNQVLAVVKMPNIAINETLLQKDLSLYLDGIQDPGNMGTILRIADWFGIVQVFCSLQSADLYNPKVMQATMGAFLRVNVQRYEFDDLLKKVPNIPVYGAVLGGKNIFKETLNQNALLVIGNEGQGISKAIMQKLTHKISIPAPANGGAESLNAGVATGIICSVFRNS